MISRVFLDDGLGRNGCTCTATCRREIGSFRATGSASRAAGTNYLPLMPAELASLPPPAFDHGLFALATLDLDAYADYDALMEAARVSTEKRGRINREVARAERTGYYAKPFPFALHVPDIVAIHNSKETRDGRPIKGKFYHQGVAELGGEPTAPIAIEAPACPHHHTFHWGVFQREDGYMQGTVRTDERLVGYLGLIRRGNSAWYSRVMGHGDHLKNGVMYLLHYAFTRAMMAERPAGLRYLVFFEYARNTADARVHWKKLLMFEPRYLQYADDRAFAWPAEPAPDAGPSLLALKTTLDQPWTRAVAMAADLGIGPAWLDFLHRSWVIENARAPGLTARVLRERGAPSLDTLEIFAPHLFPREALDGVERVAVLLDDRSKGIDTLLPLANAGWNDVTVFHADPAEREALRTLYGDRWSYAASAEDVTADLMIAGGALPKKWQARRVLVSVPNANAELPQALSHLRRGISTFRSGDPLPRVWLLLE